MAFDFGNGRGQPPSADDLIGEMFGRLRRTGGNRLAWVGAAVLLALWLASGVYQVNPSEVGVVLRFGKVVDTTPPGLHWHIPWPVDAVIKTPITRVLKEEIGFRTIDPGPPARYREVVEESRMLTSDGNLIDVDFIVQYRIGDPLKFLFNVRDPRETLRDVAESAMRRVVGSSSIDSALTEGRLEIQTRSQEILQQILDRYESGLLVSTVKLQDVVPPEPVQDAFKDVINAEQDRERMINEAEGFANDILPKARGSAAQLVNEAQGYSEAKQKEAQGEARRFDLILDAYRKAPEVTRERLYLETIEKLLADSDKIVLDDAAAQRAVPILPVWQAFQDKQLLPAKEESK